MKVQYLNKENDFIFSSMYLAFFDTNKLLMFLSTRSNVRFLEKFSILTALPWSTVLTIKLAIYY